MKHLSSLYPFQKMGVVWLEEKNGRGIIGDEMGLGKTIQSLAYLKRHPELRPALVVCPATIKLNWKKEIFEWLGEDSFLITGKKSRMIPEYPIYIINWDILASEITINNENNKPKKILIDTSWIFKLIEFKIKIIIGDEVQNISNIKAIRTKGFSTLVQTLSSSKLIMLSGTPIKNRPSEFFTILNLISPEDFPNYYKYLYRYCGPVFNGFGWTFKGATHIDELHEKIKPYMIRREKINVLTDLPPKNRIVIELETDKLAFENYEKATEEFLIWLADHLNSGAIAQTNIDRLKQLAYIAKRNSAIKWIEEYIETGNKLVVGAFHTNAINDIVSYFNKKAIKIDGSITGKERHEAVETFQNNPDIKIIVCQILTVPGLTLTAASATATVEFGWSAADHEQFEDRVHRISQTADSVFAYYLVGAETIDSEIIKIIQKKYEVTKKILDGKDNAKLFDEGVLGSLMEFFKNKIRKG